MTLLEMDISAGVLIALLLILRFFALEKLPKRMFAALWMLALLRLLIPAELPMQGGIATPVLRFLYNIKSAHGTRNVPMSVNMAGSGTADDFAGGFSAAGFPVCRWIWLAGAVICGARFFCAFRREYRLLAQALPLHCADMENLQGLADTSGRLAGVRVRKLYMHDRIATPLVAGVFKQRIVLPKQLAKDGRPWMGYVLTHEMLHIKRGDNFRKLLSAVVVCIHWYNPLVWVMYLLFARDLELSCDESVLAFYGEAGRKEYADALLSIAQERQAQTLFYCGFGKNPTKERIVAIMEYKKMNMAKAFCAVCLLAGATTVFAANGQSASGRESAAAADEVRLETASENVASENVAPDAAANDQAAEKKAETEEPKLVIVSDDKGQAEAIAEETRLMELSAEERAKTEEERLKASARAAGLDVAMEEPGEACVNDGAYPVLVPVDGQSVKK